jgi:hypothetical protein
MATREIWHLLNNMIEVMCSNLRSRRPLKGMELKRRHRIARLQWARARLRWMRNTWQNVLFSDESKFVRNYVVAYTKGSPCCVHSSNKAIM